MILVDTNVVSEVMRPRPNDIVRRWLDEREEGTLYLSSVTLAELLVGVAIAPDGKRKQELRSELVARLMRFGGRILPFDDHAAHHYAQLFLAARKTGQGFPIPDGYIAAIAASRGFAVATRDTAPYAAAGVAVINPWSTAAAPAGGGQAA